jgi:hypothetical protein
MRLATRIRFDDTLAESGENVRDDGGACQSSGRTILLECCDEPTDIEDPLLTDYAFSSGALGPRNRTSRSLASSIVPARLLQWRSRDRSRLNIDQCLNGIPAWVGTASFPSSARQRGGWRIFFSWAAPARGRRA